MPVDIVSAPHTGNHTIFLAGPPGCGKTTVAIQRLEHLLKNRVPTEQILILVPQRTLAAPYYRALHRAESPAGGIVDIATIGGLARRTLDLFWPLVAATAGFAHPDRRPCFLTLETAQYHMDRIVEPFIAQGAFGGLTISRSRLVSQIIDNLNKAAAVGFPLDEIASRLKAAWAGESARLPIFDQVQEVALAFRRFCLAENLLDWSLQIELLWHKLLPLPQFRRYLLGGYRHLIVDNPEEDIPVTHDLLRIWLPLCDSALVIYDTDGGYRIFLGADPKGALALADLCREHIVQASSHVTSVEMEALGLTLARYFIRDLPTPRTRPDPLPVLHPQGQRFHPQMLDWVSQEVARLVMEEGIPPDQIAILAPFLSDALRFSLIERLQQYGIHVRTHRPSRELGEEPTTRCLLTLAKLAHPVWRRPPPPPDVAHALRLAIADLDPVRAHLLAEIVYRVRDSQPILTPFYQIVPTTQERISYLLGGRYDELWRWMQTYINRQDGPERLDFFLSRLFGELLSQPGFRFHRDLDAGALAANLIESIRKFFQVFPSFDQERKSPTASALTTPSEQPPTGAPTAGAGIDLGLEHVDMVERGILAAQYISSWLGPADNAVLLVPAYTFLMMNQPVSIQFWLDAGSRAWFERIYQPLTHPYVLRRDWPGDQLWTDEEEVRVREEALGRLILGLTRRCRQRVYLAYSELNERGYEQRGPLLQAVQRTLLERKRS
ncbi:MAG: ATP-binding protein [Anaerolineae bacterium]